MTLKPGLYITNHALTRSTVQSLDSPAIKLHFCILRLGTVNAVLVALVIGNGLAHRVLAHTANFSRVTTAAQFVKNYHSIASNFIPENDCELTSCFARSKWKKMQLVSNRKNR